MQLLLLSADAVQQHHHFFFPIGSPMGFLLELFPNQLEFGINASGQLPPHILRLLEDCLKLFFLFLQFTNTLVILVYKHFCS